MPNDSHNRLQAITQKFESITKIHPFTNKHWRADIDASPGVYVIWHARGNRQAVYVGETTHLNERLRDLGHWRNHTFTRQIRQQLIHAQQVHSPEAIRTYIKQYYRLSYLPLDFGRKEVEEYLIEGWETEQPKGFNKVAKRYRRGKASTCQR